MSKQTKLPKFQQTKTNSFRRLRLNVELTQMQLAGKIGVAVSTIRRWEQGQAEPTMTVTQMRNFCEAVNQNFNDLPKSFLLSNESSLESKPRVSGRESLSLHLTTNHQSN